MSFDLLKMARISAKPEAAIREILDWLNQVYLYLEQTDAGTRLDTVEVDIDAAEARLDTVESTINDVNDLGALTQTISNPPTQAQVQAIQTKVNAVIAALNIPTSTTTTT